MNKNKTKKDLEVELANARFESLRKDGEISALKKITKEQKSSLLHMTKQVKTAKYDYDNLKFEYEIVLAEANLLNRIIHRTINEISDR